MAQDGNLLPFEMLLFDGLGGCRCLDGGEREAFSPPADGVVWLHFDYSRSEARQWIEAADWLDPIIKANLLDDTTRPRSFLLNDTLFLSLRGVNFNPGAEPEDMIAVRLWLTEKTVITSSRRQLRSLADIRTLLAERRGPRLPQEFLMMLLANLSYHTEEVVEQLEDGVGEVEEEVLVDDDPEHKSQLAEIRRRTIRLRRYLAPQREALHLLLADAPSWISKNQKMHIRETINVFSRYLAILDITRERAIVTYEELLGRMSERLNQRMYILSIVATIFMPLGFLTGLLGINVGGVPGGHSAYGFWLATSAIAGVAAALIVYLKHKQWF